MSISLNSYDYKLLVETTITNFYAYKGKYLPNSFKGFERAFYMELLIKYNIGHTNVLRDERGHIILNMNVILDEMATYKAIHNKKYRNRPIYRLELNFSNVSKTYLKLKDIFTFGYGENHVYKNGIRGIHNFIEIWDQNYLSEDVEGILDTRVLFIYDPQGKTDLSEYLVPVVAYDLRLGNFLGIDPKYWNKIRNFRLDCRSNMFLEIMKHWNEVLVNLADCPSKTQYAKCYRTYTRTKESVPIWGSCPRFNEKLERMPADTIHYRNSASWQREIQNYRVSS